MRRQGEILIVRSWRGDVDVGPAADFTIVLTEQPAEANAHPAPAMNVAVCAPARGVRLHSAVAEATAAYDAGTTSSTTPVRLHRGALDAFADGVLISAHAIAIEPREIFRASSRGPTFDGLARCLLRGGQRIELFWRALDQCLAQPREASRMPNPDNIRSRLRTAVTAAAQAPKAGLARVPIKRLRAIADGASPDGSGATREQLADDVAFVRCLVERADTVEDLAHMRSYLDGARPRSESDLASDRIFTRAQLSFVTLLSNPHMVDAFRAGFEMFQAAYVTAYAAHHESYHESVAVLRERLEDAAHHAQALARLNTLRGLGQALGIADLTAYEGLTQALGRCDQRDLDSLLLEGPTCPTCAVSMDERVPTAEAERVLRGLRIALEQQQTRLASEAVRRILARGGERLERFLSVVQASNVAALTRILDDDLLSFLDELLSQAVSPTADALAVFDELVRAHPVVGEEQVDAAAETFRRLLAEQIAAQRSADREGAASIRLASGSSS